MFKNMAEQNPGVRIITESIDVDKRMTFKNNERSIVQCHWNWVKWYILLIFHHNMFKLNIQPEKDGVGDVIIEIKNIQVCIITVKIYFYNRFVSIYLTYSVFALDIKLIILFKLKSIKYHFIWVLNIIRCIPVHCNINCAFILEAILLILVPNCPLIIMTRYAVCCFSNIFGFFLYIVDCWHTQFYSSSCVTPSNSYITPIISRDTLIHNIYIYICQNGTRQNGTSIKQNITIIKQNGKSIKQRTLVKNAKVYTGSFTANATKILHIIATEDIWSHARK